MTEILKIIELIEDKRQEKKVRHKLLDIVVVMLFAKLANADDWQEVEIFAKSNEEFLRQYIELENGISSHYTMQRVMGSIAPEYMQDVYKKWNGLVNGNEGEALQKNHLYRRKNHEGQQVKRAEAGRLHAGSQREPKKSVQGNQ